ncbi:MAG: DUF420 domain-containing protein [Fuerstiella sp.]
MSRNSLIFGAVLWTAVFGFVAMIWQQRPDAEADDPAQTAAPAEQSSAEAAVIKPETRKDSANVSFPARTLPDFEFDECLGGKFGIADLKGKPWVASFVFTRCQSTCPMITTSMMRLHDSVKDKNKDVMFLTITVDPKFDTTEILKTYSETFRPDRDRWKFVTGGQQEIFELVVNGFGLYVKENLGEARLPGFEVAHSNRVVLVNEEGIPVGTFLGTRDEDMVKLRRILSGAEDFPAAGPALSFSTSDGSPLDIKFELQPIKEQPEQPATGENSEANDETSATKEESAAPVIVSDDSDKDANNDSGNGGGSENGVSKDDEVQPLSAIQHNALIDQKMPAWTKSLPSINASLNTLAGILLMLGYVAIKKGHKNVHRNLMISAFISSVAFLGCYLLYHQQLGEHTGMHGKKFPGAGLAATIYPLVLVPHVILATFVPFLAIRVFQHAFAGRWDAHKRLAKITFPIWMYVSVTGVVIYAMLYHWPLPSPAPVAAG